MAGIAGIAEGGREKDVRRMLELISHRGVLGMDVTENRDFTLGTVMSRSQRGSRLLMKKHVVQDYVSDSQYAEAMQVNGRLMLLRDPLGVAPLYHGKTADGSLCFASEVKALQELTSEITEFPPGYGMHNGKLERYFTLQKKEPLEAPAATVSRDLRKKLHTAIARSLREPVMGAWLSGGLDSSALAALARPYVRTLHTFAAGIAGAPDLHFARVVAAHLNTQHHEIVTDIPEMLAILPKVIYHLESFDALLVRSSIMNFLASRAAADFVAELLSGEGGDELFAGYEYLKSLPPAELPDELLDLTTRLHNTALQRVDRSASAHGLVAHVPFLNPAVVEYAIQIPLDMKIRDGVEKWILRKAVEDFLPREILDRKKSKFWEGAGVGDLLARHADAAISDSDFSRERALPNGWTLNSKEELMYYRIFREHFPRLDNLSWMGRTKGAPVRQMSDQPPMYCIH